MPVGSQTLVSEQPRQLLDFEPVFQLHGCSVQLCCEEIPLVLPPNSERDFLLNKEATLFLDSINEPFAVLTVTGMSKRVSYFHCVRKLI